MAVAAKLKFTQKKVGFNNPLLDYTNDWAKKFPQIDNADIWLRQLEQHWAAAGESFGTEEESRINDPIMAKVAPIPAADKPKVHLALLLGKLQEKIGNTPLTKCNLNGLELVFKQPCDGETYNSNTDETTNWSCSGCIWFVGEAYSSSGQILMKFQITFFTQAYYHPRSYRPR